jgi:hypothetical protein
MTRAVGRPANIGGGKGFRDSPGEVLVQKIPAAAFPLLSQALAINENE